ncbi:MAG: hypothetical protein V4510_02940 [bacterium]
MDVRRAAAIASFALGGLLIGWGSWYWYRASEDARQCHANGGWFCNLYDATPASLLMMGVGALLLVAGVLALVLRKPPAGQAPGQGPNV